MPKLKPEYVNPGDWVAHQDTYWQVDQVTRRLTGGASGGRPVTDVSAHSVKIEPGPDGMIEVLPGPPPEIHRTWVPESQQWAVTIDASNNDGQVDIEVSLDGGVLYDSQAATR